jgi:copper resistance protein C
MSRLLQGVASVLLGLGIVVAAPAAVFAHTDLVASTPAEDAVADRAVTSVRLSFESPLRPGLAEMVVIGEGGDRVVGPPTVEGRQVRIPVHPLDVAGRYEVSYRVVSVDGHPITGHFRFEVSAQGARSARELARSERGLPVPPIAEASSVSAPEVVVSLGGADSAGWSRLAPEAGVVVLALLIFVVSLGRRTRLHREGSSRG